MIVMGVLLAGLAVAGIAATLVEVARDGYGRAQYDPDRVRVECS